VISAAVLLTAVRLGAQLPPAAPPPPASAPAPAHPPTPAEATPKFDPAAVERGKALLVAQCGFCHGSNARGGQQGPDLTRSDLVQSDENGKQLAAFLKVGRPELKMPKFDKPPVIDGKLGTRFQMTKGMATHTVAMDLAAGAHTLELYRESEASYGVSQFLAITEATLMTPPAAPAVAG